MDSPESVTQWIRDLAGDDPSDAQEKLFQRYFQQLVSVARERLWASARSAEDEEDVALCALDSFFRRASQGQFPGVVGRSELWSLLVTITTRKAIDQWKRQSAEKRGGSARVVHETSSGTRASMRLAIEDLVADQPPPELLLQLTEECDRQLASLEDDQLRKVARMKLEGYTNQEIALELHVAERTIGRKLNRIRREWSQGLEE